MKSIFKSVVAFVLGAICAGLIIQAIEVVNIARFPLPAGVTMDDMPTMRKYVATLPIDAFLTVLLAWSLGTFVGAAVAAYFAPRAPLLHSLAVGALFLASGIAMCMMLPHPAWFNVIGLACFLPTAFLGGLLGTRRHSCTDSCTISGSAVS